MSAQKSIRGALVGPSKTDAPANLLEARGRMTKEDLIKVAECFIPTDVSVLETLSEDDAYFEFFCETFIELYDAKDTAFETRALMKALLLSCVFNPELAPIRPFYVEFKA